MAIALPIVLKYVAPVVISFVAGHISGWFHHKSSAAKKAAATAQEGPN